MTGATPIPETGATPIPEIGSTSLQNPFPGLRPFLAGEEHLFFGREHQVDAMVDRLAAARFLTVVGTSGSGKSSLVNCGLRPALHRGWMAAAGSSWRIAQFRPSGQPIQSMICALSEDGVLFTNHQGPIPLDEIVDTHLRLSKRGLIDLVRKARLPQGANLLIVVDQFEELFRYARLGAASEAVALVNLLLEVRHEPDCGIYVVLTMRSDFLGDCSQFHGLPEAINAGQYLVPRMTRDERRAAIAGPVGVGGAEIDPALLTRVVNDVGDNPDQLSILQHALNRTWGNWAHEGKAAGPLRIQHYEAIGTMERALDRHAEKAFAELGTERNQMICERIFRALTDKGMDARGVRRPTTFAELCALAEARPEEVSRVIDVFRKPSRAFLMPPAPAKLEPNTIIDISHESLMRVWNRLNQWVEEESECASQYRRLAESAALHLRGDAGLIADPELALMLAWRERSRPNSVWAARYRSGFVESLDFLESSRKVRDRSIARRRLEKRMWVASAVILGLFLVGYSWKRAQHARDEERAARVHSALSAQDPLVAALAVAELGYSAASKEPLLAIQQVATAAIPSAVLGERDPQSPSPPLLGAWFESGAKQVTTVSTSAAFRRWPADGGGTAIAFQPVAFQPSASHRLAAVAVSADRKWLAGASHDGTGWVVSSDGSVRVSGLKVPGQKITAIAFSPDATQIWTGYTDYHVRIWARDGTFLRIASGRDPVHTGPISSIQIEPGGKRALTSSWDKTVRIWDVKTLKPVAAIPGGESRVFAAAFSPDGKWVVCGYEDGLAEIWRSDGTGKPRRLEGHAKPVTSVAFSPDGSKVITGSEDLTARIWNLEVDNAGLDETFIILGATAVLRGHTGAVRAVAFSGDGSQAITADDDGTARIWWSDPREPRILGKHRKTVQSVAFSPDGKSVVSSSDDQTARVWKLNEPAGFLHYEAQGYVRSAAFDPTGARVVAGSEDGVFSIWDLTTNRKVLRQEKGGVLSVAFTPDGAGILTGTRDDTVRVWSTDSSVTEPLLTLKGHKDWVFHASFSPDRSRIATASSDRTVRVWPVSWENGILRRKGEPLILPHPDRVLKAAFSPDGLSLATACADGRARIWKLTSPQNGPRQFPYREDLFSVAFSSDGKWLLTSSKDKTSTIWSVSEMEPYLVLLHGPSEVRAAAFGPGDAYVVTGAGDGFVRLWRTSARDLVEYMGKASNACLTPRERVRFLGDSEDASHSTYAGCEAAHGRAAAKAPETSTR